jgi:hypothetical protein
VSSLWRNGGHGATLLRAHSQVLRSAHGLSSGVALQGLYNPPAHLRNTFYESLCAYGDLRVQLLTLARIIPHRRPVIGCKICDFDTVRTSAFRNPVEIAVLSEHRGPPP